MVNNNNERIDNMKIDDLTFYVYVNDELIVDEDNGNDYHSGYSFLGVNDYDPQIVNEVSLLYTQDVVIFDIDGTTFKLVRVKYNYV